MTAASEPVREARRNPFAGYAEEERPLGSYAVLAAVFNAGFASALVAAEGSGRLPNRIGAGDLVLLGLGTHKLSRLLAKDWVTSFLRAPFTEFEEEAGGGEVKEKPRGKGMQQALGELLTCPFCIGQWVAAGYATGYIFKPRVTRVIAGMFATITLSDFLHQAYAALKEKA